MDPHDRRLKILRDVEQGILSIEEGSRLLAGLQEDVPALESVESFPEAAEESAPEVVIGPASEDFEKPRRMGLWQFLWSIPLWLGVGMTVLAIYWMYEGWQTAGPGWGFWLSFLPLLVGLGLTVLGWEITRAPWLHLRVQQKPGERPATITISIPLPVRLITWTMSRFGKHIPDKVKGQDIEEILGSVSAKNPMQIHVDDEDGEKVDIYIG